MALRVEWKDVGTSAPGGYAIGFEEAASVFGDPCSRTIPNPSAPAFDRSSFVTVGLSNRARMLVLEHIDHGRVVRILTARRAIQTTTEKHVRRRPRYDFSNGVRGKYASRFWDAAAADSPTPEPSESRR